MDAVRVFGVPEETSGQTLEVEPRATAMAMVPLSC